MLLKRMVCFLMAGLILLADGGLTVYAHTCLKTHDTSYSLYSPADCNEHANADCCGKASTNVSHCIKGNDECCSVKDQFIKQSPAGFKTDNTEKSKLPVAVLTTFFAPVNVSAPSTLFSFTYTSPPVYYKSAPAFIQVFRC